MDTTNIARIFEEAVQKEHFAGVALVQRGDQVLFSQAYGMAHRGFGVPNHMDTRFRLASASKLFTATATLQLVEQGRLSLEDRIVSLLGLEETAINPGITVKHLLTMTSGMADWFDEGGAWEADWAELIRQHAVYKFRKNEDYLPLFTHAQAYFSPGEKFRYNGAGYILQGMLIEKLTGLDYFEAIRRNVFAPAGMTRTGFFHLDGVEADVAEGYDPILDENEQPVAWRKNIYQTTAGPAADGGACSTAGDLVRFLQALRCGKLLSHEMFTQMLTPQVDEDGDYPDGCTAKRGLGPTIMCDAQGNVLRWGHPGEEIGASARVFYFPAHDLDVVVLGNVSWCSGKPNWQIQQWLRGK